ncbi:retropepsin-like aspartic protease [Acetivibrio cellulolyticus]|uniref:retropepsin-like aspartic protease n=1 Tax=Acetivibrio cellulolyticus TaxID=35830 RepID=UPI0001E2CBD1|nr:retropepsin-like aspartic protease [Acetivibrio cellulolyticus]
MNTYKFDRLICTDVNISFGGKKKVLKNVVIDTGAAQSIINSLAVEDIGISPEYVGEISTTYGIGGELVFFTKVVDNFIIADTEFKSLEMDFGEIDSKGELTGLIGMDLLEKLRAVIDVEIPLVYEK